MKISMAAIALCCWSGAAFAETPIVITDIAPVQSLVARVMEGAGTPDVLLPPGAEPHDYSLRTSDAGRLEKANVVFWVGHALDLWLEKPLENLAGNATVVELEDVDGTVTLPTRAGLKLEKTVSGEAHDHDGDHDDHAGGHHHGGTDPHMWLDPENAIAWTQAIADTLAKADPEHAALYEKNATDSEAELKSLTAELSKELSQVSEPRYIVFHDAYHYFEHRFGIPATGSISDNEATPPSAARLAGLRKLVKEDGVRCIFSEPEYNDEIIQSVFQDTPVTHAVIDPLGSDLKSGPGQYPAILKDIAAKISACGK